MATPPKPRVFVDADVLFAGAAAPSEHGASLVVLRMAEITLIHAIASQRVIGEAERNLATKLPAALPIFRLLVSRCLHLVDDAGPADLAAVAGLADAKDLPILAAAVRVACPWLVTFNVRDYRPGHPTVTGLTTRRLPPAYPRSTGAPLPRVPSLSRQRPARPTASQVWPTKERGWRRSRIPIGEQPC